MKNIAKQIFEKLNKEVYQYYYSKTEPRRKGALPIFFRQTII